MDLKSEIISLFIFIECQGLSKRNLIKKKTFSSSFTLIPVCPSKRLPALCPTAACGVLRNTGRVVWDCGASLHYFYLEKNNEHLLRTFIS